MAEEIKSLLDAVSAGIDGADSTPAPVTPPTEETPDEGTRPLEESAADESAAGGDAGEDGADANSDKKEAGDKDGTAAKGAESDKGGKKPAEGAAGAELGPDGKPKQPEPTKKADPVNDPFDSRWKDQTRTRVQSLVDMVKQRDGQLEQANSLFDAIDSTGMGPDELATMLGYARIRHHGTAEEKKQAYAFLKSELRGLALEVGETDVVDFTSEHQDLQDAVAANTITVEFAREVALARSRAKRDTEASTATTAQTEAQRAHAAGTQALGQTAGALSQRDGAAVYGHKHAILVATLKPVLAQLPPSKWAKAYQDAYEALPKPVAAAPVAPVKPQPQPLRPGTPAGGSGKKEPKSLLDAVSAAIDGDSE